MKVVYSKYRDTKQALYPQNLVDEKGDVEKTRDQLSATAVRR